MTGRFFGCTKTKAAFLCRQLKLQTPKLFFKEEVQVICQYGLIPRKLYYLLKEIVFVFFLWGKRNSYTRLNIGSHYDTSGLLKRDSTLVATTTQHLDFSNVDNE